jgi:hypothetical protein
MTFDFGYGGPTPTEPKGETHDRDRPPLGVENGMVMFEQRAVTGP